MQRIRRVIAALGVIVLAATSAALAQDKVAPLQTGKWTGTVTPPGEAQVDVSYTVAVQDDSVSITIDAGPHGVFNAQGVKIEADRLVFSFRPGPMVVCALQRMEDASYAGQCTDDGGAAAQMVMVPPRKS